MDGFSFLPAATAHDVGSYRSQHACKFCARVAFRRRVRAQFFLGASALQNLQREGRLPQHVRQPAREPVRLSRERFRVALTLECRIRSFIP